MVLSAISGAGKVGLRLILAVLFFFDLVAVRRFLFVVFLYNRVLLYDHLSVTNIAVVEVGPHALIVSALLSELL